MAIILAITVSGFCYAKTPTIVETSVTAATTTVNYYYFCDDSPCKQTSIIKRLNRSGYDFKIKKNEFEKYNITSLPTILAVIKENGKVVVTVKLENRFWSKRDLRVMVNTINFLT